MGEPRSKGENSHPKRKLLNVGGHSNSIGLPSCYEGWEKVLLDVDPVGKPDLVFDARELEAWGEVKGSYDAVYCSHNLEHYFNHEVPMVLRGFLHALNEDGFAHIRVPDMLGLMSRVVEKGLDMEDVLYTAPIGPVRVRDVIYGYAPQIERSGRDFYAHKTGFSRHSLVAVLQQCGFQQVFTAAANLEIKAFAFKQKPSAEVLELLDLQAALPSSEM